MRCECFTRLFAGDAFSRRCQTDHPIRWALFIALLIGGGVLGIAYASAGLHPHIMGWSGAGAAVLVFVILSCVLKKEKPEISVEEYRPNYKDSLGESNTPLGSRRGSRESIAKKGAQ